MSNSLALYRAIRQLNELGDEEQKAIVEAIASQSDSVTVRKTTIDADEEWINAIEKGLDFVGKALDEERRFIRSNGEVLPIEKIKRVSKESIQHLARHSDYINKEKSNEIVPDKLYSVERLNDYATYENRFLYMLLNMTKDFITRKYAAITEKTAYSATIKMNKVVSLNGRRLTFEANISDSKETENVAVLNRIDKLLQSVNFYLRSPIMVEVSKVDTIHSGVTLNNVLRMDKNFVEAVALYDFLLTYDKEGLIEKSECISPTGMEFARALAFASYLQVYIAEAFSRGKDEMTELLKSEEEQEKALLIKRIEDEGAEKYIMRLKKRVDELEAAACRLKIFGEKSDDQVARIKELETELEKMQLSSLEQARRIDELLSELKSAKLSYDEQLEGIKSKSDAEIKEKQRQLDELMEQKTLAEAQLNAIRSERGEETDFSSEERFNELEREYETLGRLLDKEWKGVKKTLKKEMFADIKAVIFGKNKDKKTQNENTGKEEMQ